MKFNHFNSSFKMKSKLEANVKYLFYLGWVCAATSDILSGPGSTTLDHYLDDCSFALLSHDSGLQSWLLSRRLSGLQSWFLSGRLSWLQSTTLDHYLDFNPVSSLGDHLEYNRQLWTTIWTTILAPLWTTP